MVAFVLAAATEVQALVLTTATGVLEEAVQSAQVEAEELEDLAWK